jgi:hypothetical protein
MARPVHGFQAPSWPALCLLPSMDYVRQAVLGDLRNAEPRATRGGVQVGEQ